MTAQESALSRRIRVWLACATARFDLVLWFGVCVSCCTASSVRAQATTEVQIELQPGATCLEDVPLRQQVQDWLERPVSIDGLQIEVRGSSHDPRSVLVRLWLADAEVARRSFSPGPARCDDLHSAVALAIALMIKVAGRTADERPPREASAPEPAEQLPTGQQPIPSAEPPAKERSDLRTPARSELASVRGALSLRASGLFAAGLGRSYAGGLHGELAVALARAVELRAGLIGLFSQARALSDSGGMYTTRTLAGSLAGCALLTNRPILRVRACADLLAGRVRAKGAGFDAPQETRLPWLAAALQLELGWQLTAGWSLLATASPIVSVFRSQVVARDDAGQIVARAELPRFSAALGVGLAYTFRSRNASGQLTDRHGRGFRRSRSF